MEVKAIMKMYKGVKTAEVGRSEWFNINVEIHQGSVLFLFAVG